MNYFLPLPAPLEAITGTVTAACTALRRGMSYLKNLAKKRNRPEGV